MVRLGTQSPADAAFERFRRVLAESRLFKFTDAALSESDTRSKLIDPLFKEVLGWNEAEIRRERSVAGGFVDYVLGSDYNHLLIEAKKSKPRFNLVAPGKHRRLKLDGPHLLGNNKIKLVIEQAQSYAGDVGVQFCVATNGTQIILFRPTLPGRPWRSGTAIVFHDHADIESHFAEFYELLGRDRVIAGGLVEAFEHLERTTVQKYAVLDKLANPNRELVRNRVWQQIARIMGPLLTDQPESPGAQLEVLQYCYVTTPLADETDTSLNTLLRDVPSRHLADAKVTDLKIGSHGRTAFTHGLRDDIYQGKKGATYILTGGVGSGKTTFLRRFAQIVDRDFVDRYTAWIHIDFLPIGNVTPDRMDDELRGYVYRRVRENIQSQHGDALAGTGEKIRALFAAEIDQAKLTRLYGLDVKSEAWLTAVNALVDELMRDDERFTVAALRALRKNGRRIAIVLDNTDQLGEVFQEKVFLLSQKLSEDYEALCVVTLREEKFFAAYRRGIFDAFGDRRFHIGSPELGRVLHKRLEYGRTKFAGLASDTSSGLGHEDLRRIDALLRSLITSTTGRNANIVRMLQSVSNGDMRHALDMFREFLSSGNTNVEKILEIVDRGHGYSVPFHEFAKSAILGSRRYYQASVSHIVNLFRQSDALGSSHVTACRILARLAAAEGVASAHGEGFVSVPALLREYRQSFGFADDLVQWVGELLRRNLVESEPPRVSDINNADALRITAAGAYYWRYLVRSFAYIDLVFVDTPLTDQTVVRRLETMADKTDMTVRFERVRTFLDYVERREVEELKISAERVGPFQEPLIRQVRKQVEAEIKVIVKKAHVQDAYGRN
jgi:energy-coupling factor transporter ATP-binding protein EcfA2